MAGERGEGRGDAGTDLAGTARLRPYGERALILSLPADADRVPAGADPDQVRAWAMAVRAAAPPGLVDVVPGAAAVVVTFASAEAARAARSRLSSLPADAGARLDPDAPGGEVVELAVRYDGPDLTEVARLSGFSVEEVVRRHQGSLWQVAFGGFAPGFAYLVGGDPALAVPRRAAPRAKVPPGALALAGGYTAVYPRESPGGWQLIGSCDTPLWDLEQQPPAVLTPGLAVRFIDRQGAR